MIIVAASDSSNEDKSNATSICDGIDDQEEVQTAVQSMSQQQQRLGGTQREH